jgi:hypothetical protein
MTEWNAVDYARQSNLQQVIAKHRDDRQPAPCVPDGGSHVVYHQGDIA